MLLTLKKDQQNQKGVFEIMFHFKLQFSGSGQSGLRICLYYLTAIV